MLGGIGSAEILPSNEAFNLLVFERVYFVQNYMLSEDLRFPPNLIQFKSFHQHLLTGIAVYKEDYLPP